jgi:hypothetical protein
MQDTIKNAVKSGHGEAIVYAGALGLLFSDIIPTPADYVYFNLMQKQKRKLEEKQITPKEYWRNQAFLYYGLNPLWWGIVLGALYVTKGSYTTKIEVGLGIIAAGGVIGILNNNIKKDEQGI